MYKKRYIRKQIIFISIVLSMSIMGVGYATWNDETQINLSLKTGFIRPQFVIDRTKEAFDDGKLFFSVSNDGRKLSIEGEVYPSFNEDISIQISDEGTIPSMFNDLYKDDENISELDINSKEKQKNSFYINNDNMESFKLNINPNNNNEEAGQLNKYYSSSNDNISKLNQEIERLKEEIRLYNKEENYEFQYILTFEQSL